MRFVNLSPSFIQIYIGKCHFIDDIYFVRCHYLSMPLILAENIVFISYYIFITSACVYHSTQENNFCEGKLRACVCEISAKIFFHCCALYNNVLCWTELMLYSTESGRQNVVFEWTFAFRHIEMQPISSCLVPICFCSSLCYMHVWFVWIYHWCACVWKTRICTVHQTKYAYGSHFVVFLFVVWCQLSLTIIKITRLHRHLTSINFDSGMGKWLYTL